MRFVAEEKNARLSYCIRILLDNNCGKWTSFEEYTISALNAIDSGPIHSLTTQSIYPIADDVFVYRLVAMMLFVLMLFHRVG